jgi:hypothetical protein
MLQSQILVSNNIPHISLRIHLKKNSLPFHPIAPGPSLLMRRREFWLYHRYPEVLDHVRPLRRKDLHCGRRWWTTNLLNGGYGSWILRAGVYHRPEIANGVTAAEAICADGCSFAYVVLHSSFCWYLFCHFCFPSYGGLLYVRLFYLVIIASFWNYDYTIILLFFL